MSAADQGWRRAAATKKNAGYETVVAMRLAQTARGARVDPWRTLSGWFWLTYLLSVVGTLAWWVL